MNPSSASFGTPSRMGVSMVSGAQDVHANVAGFQVHRPGPREGTERGFARAIDADGGETHRAGDRRVQDDGAAVRKHGRGFCTVKRVPDVEVEVLSKLLGHLAEGVKFAGTCVGEKDVYATFLLFTVSYSRSRSARSAASPCTPVTFRPMLFTAASSFSGGGR